VATTVHFSQEQWHRFEQRLAAAKPPRADDTGAQDALAGEDLDPLEAERRRSTFRAKRA